MSSPIHIDRNRPKLLVLVSHPIQYYAPLYRCLAERGKVALTVVYLSDAGATAHLDAGFSRLVEWDVPLLDGYDFRVLQPGSDINARRFWSRYADDLTCVLDREKADWILLYGYSSRMNWVALRWARKNGVKVAYSSDSNVRDPQRRMVQALKRVLLGWFFRRVDAFLSTSEANAEYLLKFGADQRRICRTPFAIDVQRFRRNIDAPMDGPRRYDFVWAGKFLPRKRAGDFLAALALVANRSRRVVRACVIGDGPCREALKTQASQIPRHCTVDFAGFINQQGMPAALQSAETLVFTSDKEPYGLIATEAAAAGLALVVAGNIGCVGDTVLARPGVNALCYRTGDIPALAQAMETLINDASLRSHMQHASMAIAQGHDLSHAAQVIERVIAKVDNHA